MARNASSFATFLILCPTCFFLGILFASFPYDYPLLWTRAPMADNFLDQLESHLKLIHSAPPLIPRILHIVIFSGLVGFVIKLYKPSESNMLFDGASLALYMAGVVIYITNIVKGLRQVSAGQYGEIIEGEARVGGEEVLGREQSLSILSASNTIAALVLCGVLVLQTGQWYAERKEAQELEKMKREEAEEKKEKGKKGVAHRNHGARKDQ
ncbi:MAG: hypothetical protein M1834_003673 [Cirrosporium novae-zelandiae]|nr:MAG: hypothetical protein M1834_003673 [Cirrosporium novae-zelandiae]